jgi:hypothetical protein
MRQIVAYLGGQAEGGDCLTDVDAPTRVQRLAGRPSLATMARCESSIASGGSKDGVARALGDISRLPFKVDTHGYLS